MNNKELLKLFKKSVTNAAEFAKTEAHLLSRDRYIRVTVDNDLPRLNKEQLNKLGGYSYLRKLYFPKPEPTKEERDAVLREAILNAYLEYTKEHGFTPSIKVINTMGFTNVQINRLFGGVSGLYREGQNLFEDIFSNLVNDSKFTEEAFQDLKKKVRKKRRFVVTTAVSGKEVDPNFLSSLKNYEEEEDALIIIQPCEDVASRNSIFKYELDTRLSDCHIAFKDLYLNSKILLSSIMVSAKQINPLTGLDRLAQSKGSMVLASPKQYLKFVANSNTKMPKALMTTGALTIADYSTDMSMSKRTSYLAEFDHKVGAVIIEIEDDKIFHFRQVQANPDGSFFDLGYKYNPDGTIEEVDKTVCVFGDTHVGSHDEKVNACLGDIAEYVNCKEIIVHDIFDCRFNNHHDVHKKATRAKLKMQEKTSLMNEGLITAKWIDQWCNIVEKVTIVKSNHDEALERYIDEGRWKDDPENLYYACDLVKKYIEGEDVLKHLVVEMIGVNEPDKINWLNRDEDYLVYGIENGAHGDKGGNGSRGSLNSVEKAYYKATVGHSHTAGILREVFQVGTSTKLKLGYNTGPSSWTNTMCIQYPTGTRQLINMIRCKDGTVKWKI